jgi:phosphate transport system substrate-binding protein
MKARVKLARASIFEGGLRHLALPPKWLLALLLTLGALVWPALAQQAVVLVGSGSTVPAPLYNRWAQDYGKRNAAIQMRYVPVGTSEGITQIAHGSGDFGAGEAPLTEKERREGGLIELPAVLIGIVPVYNLPDVHQELRLSGEVLADIFLGALKTWNVPEIAKLNPDVALPNLPIRVIQRPAGKGSNYVFTEFLSKSSAKFRAQIGVTPSPKWPVGEPAERSSDMADKVKEEAGSIGYVEFQYAVRSNIQQASVLNPAGKFVRASSQGLKAACEGVEAPRWRSFSASLINARGADAFPITSFSWIYLRARAADPTRAAALSNFLSWIYSDGQELAAEEGYTQLPLPLLAAVKEKLGELH